MERNEVLAAAQHRTGVRSLEVLEDPACAVGQCRDLVDPAAEARGIGRRHCVDRDPAVRMEVLDHPGTLVRTESVERDVSRGSHRRSIASSVTLWSVVPFARERSSVVLEVVPPLDRQTLPLGVVHHAATLGYVSLWFAGGRTDVVDLLVGPDDPPTTVAGQLDCSAGFNGYVGTVVRPGEYWMATSKHPDSSGVLCMFTPFD